MKIEQLIASVRAFYKNDYLSEIIELCNLIPINNWRAWSDGFGNRLDIYDNKIIIKRRKILPENAKPIDIYCRRHPKDNIKYSHWAFFIFGDNICYIFAIGKDNILRMMIFENGKWIKNMSPLKFNIYQLISMMRAKRCGIIEKSKFTSIKKPIKTIVIKKMMMYFPISEENMNKIKELNEQLAEELQ